MRSHAKLVAVAVLGLALGAIAGGITIPTAQVYWQETQPGTRDVPDGGCACPQNGTATGNYGLCLNGLTTLHVTASCTDNSNVTAGSLTGYYCSPKLGVWALAPTYANITLPTGGNPAIGPEFQVGNPFGRMLWASSGVTCSGGSWDGGVLVTAEMGQQ